jgi:hypothetical protein
MQMNHQGTVVMTPPARTLNSKEGTRFTFAQTRDLVTDFATACSRETLPYATQKASVYMPLHQLQALRHNAQRMAFILCMNRNATGRNDDTISVAVAGINKNNQALNSLIFEKWFEGDWLSEASVIPQGITEKVIDVSNRCLPLSAPGTAAARTQTQAFAAQWQQRIDAGGLTPVNPAVQPLAFSLPAAVVDEWSDTPGLEAVMGLFGYRQQQGVLTLVVVGINKAGRPLTAPLYTEAMEYSVAQAQELMDDMLTYDFL